MHRLAPRLFTLYTAASLVLCVTACLLWVRSHVRGDILDWERSRVLRSRLESQWTQLTCFDGVISFYGQQSTSPLGPHDDELRAEFAEEVRSFSWEVEPWPDWSLPDAGWWTQCGFHFSHIEPVAGEVTETVVAVPYWLLAVLTAVPPAYAARRMLRKRRRARLGPCASCGYDLRASPERCPECAAAVAAPRRGILPALRLRPPCPPDRCPECGLAARPKTSSRENGVGYCFLGSNAFASARSRKEPANHARPDWRTKTVSGTVFAREQES